MKCKGKSHPAATLVSTSRALCLLQQPEWIPGRCVCACARAFLLGGLLPPLQKQLVKNPNHRAGIWSRALQTRTSQPFPERVASGDPSPVPTSPACDVTSAARNLFPRPRRRRSAGPRANAQVASPYPAAPRRNAGPSASRLSLQQPQRTQAPVRLFPGVPAL